MRFIMALVLCAAAGPLFAQEGMEGMKEQTPKEMAQHTADVMEHALKLTPDQKSKVSAVLEAQASERAELTQRLQKLERLSHEKIRAILDDEQKEKFDMFRAQRRMMGGQGMGSGMPPMPMGQGMQGMQGMQGGMPPQGFQPGPDYQRGMMGRPGMPVRPSKTPADQKRAPSGPAAGGSDESGDAGAGSGQGPDAGMAPGSMKR